MVSDETDFLEPGDSLTEADNPEDTAQPSEGPDETANQ